MDNDNNQPQEPADNMPADPSMPGADENAAPAAPDTEDGVAVDAATDALKEAGDMTPPAMPGDEDEDADGDAPTEAAPDSEDPTQ